MAKYDILGDIVSPEALKQLQEIEKLATSIGKSLQGVKLSDLSKGGKDAANLEKLNAQTQLLIEKTKLLEQQREKAASKRITETNDELKAMRSYYSELEKSSAKEAAAATKAADEKRRAQEAVAAANEKARKSTADYKVGVSALSNVEKLKAVITSEHTSALQKLDAQMRLLEIEMQAKFNPALAEQEQEFRDLNAQHKAMQQEFNRTARATGVMGRSSKSAYGSFFQMTQVMRELPNFAIDARIGFMSLSNNLPMLADEFKAVRQEIIDTQGAAGATGKAWAALGKSLLSLNTIMIVASTLLVLFGDDIIEAFTGKTPPAKKALDDFTEALKKNSTEMTGVMKNISDMHVLLNNIDSKYITSKEVLEKYNSTLGETFGKETDIAGVRQALIDKGDNYIDIILRLSKAHFIQANAISMVSEAYALENDKEVKWYQNLWTTVKSFAGGKTMVEAVIAGSTNQIKGKRMLDAKKLMEDAKAEMKRFNEEIDLIYKDAAEKGIDLNGKDDPNKTGKTGKTFTGIDAKKDFYDKQRGEILIRLKEIEDDVRKSNVEGDINAYDKRKTAALAFLDFTTKLAKMDAKVAKDAADEKKRIELKQAEDKHNKNIVKFGKDTPLGKKSAEELAAANEIILENHALALQEIDDKLKVNLLDANIQYAGHVRSIHSDMYADDVYMLQQTEAQKQAILDASYEKQKANIQKRSLLQTLGDKLGIGGVSRFDEIAAESAYKGATRANKRATLTNKLNDPNASGEDKKQAERDLYALDLQSEQDYLAEKRALEIENEQIVADAKTSIAADVIDTLKSIWDSYYQYQEDKIEKDLDKQTRINNERIKQYEDETEAGLHTAKELSDFKERATVYQQSVEEEAARKKEELQKKQFLTEQAFAIGQVWINYAINVAKAGVNAVAQAWLLGSAIASTALITAQSIPAFEQGGVVGKDGTILAGEKRHELAILPDGSFFVTANKPTLYDVPKGTEIMPDLNKIDIMDILHLKPLYANHSEDKQLIREMQNVTRAIKTQKQGNFYGMPLIKQLDNRGRFDSRRKSLMN